MSRRARAAATLTLLAVAARALVAWRTAVPARDADSYLWMAERMASGDLGALFVTVFHPLYSLLVGGLLVVAPELSPVVAGQVVACGCGALAVIPLHAVTRRMFGARASNVTAVFYAVGIWFVRHPADCLSEGPFFLVAAWAVNCIIERDVRTRDAVLFGVLAGLAYGLRPEGAALGVFGAAWLAMRGGRAGAALAFVAFVCVAAPWPIGWSIYGDGFTLTPKAAFNYEQGIGGVPGNPAQHYFENLVGVAGNAFEAIGYVALPLAVFGIWRYGRFRPTSPTMLLLGLFGLQFLVVPALRSNIRFLAGFGMLLLPFAGHGATLVHQRIAHWPRFAIVTLALLAVGADLARLPRERRADRVVLIELGQFLRPELGAGERLATEMPRLAYFAGQPPLPPRPIDRAELLATAAEANTRFVAVVAERSAVTVEDFAPLGFTRLPLPDRLRTLVDARGILVLTRE